MRRTCTIARVAGSLALAGPCACYSGMHDVPAADEATDAEPGSDDDAGNESGSGDETAGDPNVACDDAEDVGATPLRRLTRREYANAIADLLAVQADVSGLEDEKLAAFDSNLAAAVDLTTVTQYRTLAEDVGAAAIEDLAAHVPCVPA